MSLFHSAGLRSRKRKETMGNDNLLCVESEITLCSASYISWQQLLLLHLFNGTLFQDNLGKPVPERQNQSGFTWGKRRWSLGCSGISWTICKQSAHHCRQITTPTLQSVSRMLFLTPNQQCHSSWQCCTICWHLLLQAVLQFFGPRPYASLHLAPHR